MYNNHRVYVDVMENKKLAPFEKWCKLNNLNGLRVMISLLEDLCYFLTFTKPLKGTNSSILAMFKP